jgi:hypothetical protein
MGGMIARTRQQARLPLAAIAVLALLAFAAFSAIRATPISHEAFSTSAGAPAISTLSLQPLQAETNSCASGTAYVTGDMVGDASPAQVYATLCP